MWEELKEFAGNKREKEARAKEITEGDLSYIGAESPKEEHVVTSRGDRSRLAFRKGNNSLLSYYSP